MTTIASAVIITYFVICPSSRGSRFMGLGVFVFIGELSYTVYLVHYPVYLIVQEGYTGLPYLPNEILGLAISFAIATASWFLMERPLMRWRQRSAERRLAT